MEVKVKTPIIAKLNLALCILRYNVYSMTCYCYILECSDGTFYTGWTTDPQRRLSQHNKGIGARYTRARCPVNLVYVEELENRKEAMKREAAIKKMNRAGKIKLMGDTKKQGSL